MPNLRYVLGDLGAASRRQTSVDELLRTIAVFDGRRQENLAAVRGLKIYLRFAVQRPKLDVFVNC